VSSSRSNTDYTGVTETPGTLISRDAASMALSRYELVRELAAGLRVLEIACGSGQGLRYVAREAAWTVGGDITSGLLARAQQHNRGAVPLVQFDAHHLPFSNASFDLIQIHEALYYMQDPSAVFEECRRVLRSDGVLVISSINPDWPDFNPSPFATSYLSAVGLETALLKSFREAQIQFGFAVKPPTPVGVAVSALKRISVRLNLIPKTMSRKALLKRMFLGPLVPVPAELTPGCAPIDTPQHSTLDSSPRFRIIYAVARS